MSTDVASVLAHGGAIGRSRNYEADRGADCGYGFSKTSGPYRLGVMARTQREHACASAERKNTRSQTKINNEKIKLSEEYQKCMKKAEGDKDKEAECEKYLKAAEALK